MVVQQHLPGHQRKANNFLLHGLLQIGLVHSRESIFLRDPASRVKSNEVRTRPLQGIIDETEPPANVGGKQRTDSSKDEDPLETRGGHSPHFT